MQTSIQVTRNKIIRVSYAICNTNPLDIFRRKRKKEKGEAKEGVEREREQLHLLLEAVKY